MAKRGFRVPLHHTSAKTGEGCEELRDAIVEAIDWQGIPETTSPALYHRIKQEILSLRDGGLVLIRLSELKQRMEMTLRDDNFKLSELEAVVSLLASPGMIKRLDFGGFILLRPEILSPLAELSLLGALAVAELWICSGIRFSSLEGLHYSTRAASFTGNESAQSSA